MMTSVKPRALFLDRDGVINVDRNYVFRAEDFTFVAGIFDLVSMAKSLDMPVIVVTNQSGIGRGYYSEADFQELTRWMIQRFNEYDAHIDRVYHCPYHPEAKDPEYRHAHPWRKPAPGMLLQAEKDFGLNLSASILIGDNWTDIAAATQAGVKTTFLIGAPERQNALAQEPTYHIDTLSEVTAWLINNTISDIG